LRTDKRPQAFRKTPPYGDAARSDRANRSVTPEKAASTDYPIHELLADRWSPYAFADRPVPLANLVVEATSRGLSVHQMIGIIPDKARETYAIPEGHQASTAVALGYLGNPASLPDPFRERDLAPRRRKLLHEFVFSGKWGTPTSLALERKNPNA